ncbi:hypothetical protein Droror1_Dr00013752 [Drosera rotundifolia]
MFPRSTPSVSQSLSPTAIPPPIIASLPNHSYQPLSSAAVSLLPRLSSTTIGLAAFARLSPRVSSHIIPPARIMIPRNCSCASGVLRRRRDINIDFDPTRWRCFPPDKT